MKFTVLAFAALWLAGCSQTSGPIVTADLTYTNAGGFGTQNAADYRPGSMFIWNTSTNSLQFIDTLNLHKVSTDILPGTRTSNRIGGIAVAGVPASLAGQEGLLSASIGAQSTFSVTGGFREDYSGVQSNLSEYVGQMLARGDDPDLLFRPREDDHRVVVIRSVLRAQESSLRIGGTDATNPVSIARIQLNSPIGEIASINVRAGTSTTCGAPPDTPPHQRPMCFFNVVVYKPVYVADNKRLQWENIPFPNQNLPAAFRSIR